MPHDQPHVESALRPGIRFFWCGRHYEVEQVTDNAIFAHPAYAGDNNCIVLKRSTVETLLGLERTPANEPAD